MTRPATTALFKTAGQSAADRAAAVATAAESLARGLLVVFPTETVYGLAASAASREGLDRLTQATAKGHAADAPRAPAWHAHSVDVVKEVIRFDSPVHRRLLKRLLPGPITFLVEKSAEELAAIGQRLGTAPGTLQGSELAFRVPDHALTREILAAAWDNKTPVVAEGIAAANLGRGTTISDELARAAEGTGPPSAEWISIIIDDGPTRLSKPSSVVRLKADGDFEVLSEGALESRFIRKQLDRNILFVCTGNTCRSPMAEAIASHALSAAAKTHPTPSPIRTQVRSAGISAYDGEPISREAVQAVIALGIEPGQLDRHMSRELTRQMIADADVIFAMTGSHARSVLAADPTASGKVLLLDPSGEDVPDPLGGPLELYTSTAARLKDLIQLRLEELDRA